jgi:hypothetical protein
MLATLRLFKAVPVGAHSDASVVDPELAAKTLPLGFIFAPGITAGERADELVRQVNELYGRNPVELNAAFHKSFAKVRDSSMFRLRIEQMLHYLTTYGFEMIGLYDEGRVFIPREQLDIPELSEDLPLVVIRGLTVTELRVELMKLLGSGIALHAQTVADAVAVGQLVGLTVDDLGRVRNKEVQAALYRAYELVPAHPESFLRFCVYQATGSSLLIKNDTLIEQLKMRTNDDLTGFFDRYAADHGPERLASIFLRFKPIFLAMRTNAAMRTHINRIRRLAVKHHRPLPEDYLNSVTARIKAGTGIDTRELVDALERANTFRKVRLAYALKVRASELDSILYRVRNGKSWATEFSFDNKVAVEHIGEIVYHSIVADVAHNVAGKTVYIPAGLHYTLPATEKQFTGNLPTGSYVEVAKNLVCGIHWENVPGHRVDLDLSLTHAGGKIGWDSAYRDLSRSVYFSGDMTDAPPPLGASEFYHVGPGVVGCWLMQVNYYNYSELHPVPFRIVASQEPRTNVNRNFLVDPNNILAAAHTELSVRQKTLGIIVADGKSTRFHFAETAFQGGRSSRANQGAEHARKFLMHQYTDAISLNDVLVAAGARVVADSSEGVDIDLSPEEVDKTTIVNLLVRQDTGALIRVS